MAQIPNLGLSLQPSGMQESISLNVELPLGSSLDSTEEVLDEILAMAEKDIDGYSGISITADPIQPHIRGD